MRSAAAALALLALLPACGVVSREANLRSRLRPEADAAEFKAIRGADPLVWQTWAASATTAASPQEALAIVERGLAYLPGQPDLTWLHLSLLAQLERHPEELAAAQAALAHGASGDLLPELFTFRLDARLAADDPHGAETEALALGSVTLPDPQSASAAWAAIALAYALHGDADEADAALDRSLQGGPRGLVALRQQAGLDRNRIAAARDLVQRADGRHPDHPDVRFYLAVQAMVDGQPAAARTALQALPAPLPWRLVPDVEALYARLDVLQGHLDAALARLRPRLDESPGETGSLAVLLECWRQHGQPSDDEMRDRVRAALHRVTDPVLAGALQAAEKELAQRAAAAQPPAAGTRS